MERLTKKTDNKELVTIGMPKAVACYWKLKKYEDIEEELGIDLITLFKALQNGFWYKKKKEILYWQNSFENPVQLQVDFENIEDSIIQCMELQKDIVYTIVCVEDFRLQEYGKTFASTREELL